MTETALLMITHNRLGYTKISLPRLLDGEGDFEVWIWDNGSTDGTADFVASFKTHPRVAQVRCCPDNAMQNIPFQWMLAGSRSPIVGKVDDDCLMPTRWVEPIAEAVRTQPILGAVGCWTFWPEDFDETRAARKIKIVGPHKILSNISIGGTGLLIRRKLCRRFMLPAGFAIPIDQSRMSAAGFINGWYYPLIWAEHMDDPRSKHCMLQIADAVTADYALTARRCGHCTAAEYLDWIRQDCAKLLGETTEEQLRTWRRSRRKKPLRRTARAAVHIIRHLWREASPAGP